MLPPYPLLTRTYPNPANTTVSRSRYRFFWGLSKTFFCGDAVVVWRWFGVGGIDGVASGGVVVITHIPVFFWVGRFLCFFVYPSKKKYLHVSLPPSLTSSSVC